MTGVQFLAGVMMEFLFFTTASIPALGPDQHSTGSSYPRDKAGWV